MYIFSLLKKEHEMENVKIGSIIKYQEICVEILDISQKMFRSIHNLEGTYELIVETIKP